MSSSVRPQPLLTVVAVALASTSAIIHMTLGDWMFTLNALGYFALVAGLIVTAFVPRPWITRLYWAPRVAVMAWALGSIGAWLIIGGFYDLGYFTKAVEAALIVVAAFDLYRAYGTASDLTREAMASVRDTIGWMRGGWRS